MGAGIPRSFSCQFGYERFHLSCSERAVESDGEDRVGAHACHEGVEGLSAQCSSGEVADSDRHHYGQVFLQSLHGGGGGVDGSLGVQCVEDGLYENDVSSAFYQSFHLFAVSVE